MAAYEKFLPEITPLHEPFWDSVRQHRMALQRCDRCEQFRFIPTEICTCGSVEWTWTPIAGTGEVYTYTVVHRAPTPAYQEDAPYVIAHATLPEGPRIISTVRCVPDDAHIGMKIRIAYDDVSPDITLYHFEPAG